MRKIPSQGFALLLLDVRFWTNEFYQCEIRNIASPLACSACRPDRPRRSGSRLDLPRKTDRRAGNRECASKGLRLILHPNKKRCLGPPNYPWYRDDHRPRSTMRILFRRWLSRGWMAPRRAKCVSNVFRRICHLEQALANLANPLPTRMWAIATAGRARERPKFHEPTRRYSFLFSKAKN